MPSGKDEAGNPVYSFNEVVAYVLTDAEGKIVDLECDKNLVVINNIATNTITFAKYFSISLKLITATFIKQNIPSILTRLFNIYFTILKIC